jgi:GR25 family glycosyltransferase involved in LPS biosynthesis
MNIKYYWINIDGSDKRKDFMEKQFKKLNIENIRVSAITPNDFDNVLEDKEPFFCGNPECLDNNRKNCKFEFGCVSSHIKALREALKSSDEYFMIVEDDIYLPFTINFTSLINDMPKDAEIIQMMILYANTVNTLDTHLYSNNVKFIKYQKILPSTGMYLITRKGAEKLVKLYYNKNTNKYDFTKFNDIKAADILLYTSVCTYATTFPYCHPNVNLLSEIHQDHINNELTATKAIRDVMQKYKNDPYILKNYFDDPDEIL